jgi:Uma2 family endonuclease
MAEVAEKLLTFEEFARLNTEGRCELVNGRLDELVPPMPLHGSAAGRIFRFIDEYVEEREPDAFVGTEVDVPTIPHFGRRPDVVYYSSSAANQGLNLRANRVRDIPTLAVEVLSEHDEARDLVTKRREYAEAGIPHYWIVDPLERTVLTLVLEGDAYRTVGEFGPDAVLTSSLFPGLEISLKRLFRQR